MLYLVEHRGSVVAVEDLFRAVWSEDFMPGSNNTAMVHIRHLREKNRRRRTKATLYQKRLGRRLHHRIAPLMVGKWI